VHWYDVKVRLVDAASHCAQWLRRSMFKNEGVPSKRLHFDGQPLGKTQDVLTMLLGQIPHRETLHPRHDKEPAWDEGTQRRYHGCQRIVEEVPVARGLRPSATS